MGGCGQRQQQQHQQQPPGPYKSASRRTRRPSQPGQPPRNGPRWKTAPVVPLIESPRLRPNALPQALSRPRLPPPAAPPPPPESPRQGRGPCGPEPAEDAGPLHGAEAEKKSRPGGQARLPLASDEEAVQPSASRGARSASLSRSRALKRDQESNTHTHPKATEPTSSGERWAKPAAP